MVVEPIGGHCRCFPDSLAARVALKNQWKGAPLTILAVNLRAREARPRGELAEQGADSFLAKW